MTIPTCQFCLHFYFKIESFLSLSFLVDGKAPSTFPDLLWPDQTSISTGKKVQKNWTVIRLDLSEELLLKENTSRLA